jgi:Ni/Fe-hydrogenase 1 B-type cytochrome subunit
MTAVSPQRLAQERLAGIAGINPSTLQEGRTIKSVQVFEAPVRVWHWVNAVAIVVLCVTGYFIGSPLPTMPGEASAHFLMGYIRFAHFASGYILAVGLLGRIYWVFAGNYHAREMFTIPVFQKAFWREVLFMARWYLFLVPRPNQFVGHNPASRLAMFGYLLVSLFMIFTGFALYGQGTQPGSWADWMFGWVIPLFGQSQDVHTWHHLGMWAMVMFMTLHVYAAIREDIMGRQSMVSTMISGRRTFKE